MELQLGELTKFGLYHWFLMATIWLAYLCNVSHVVFMVFAGVDTGGDTIVSSGEGANDSYPDMIDNLTMHAPSGTPIFESFVTEYNLRGNLSHIPRSMASVQLFGALIGALVGGQLADAAGRKLNTILMLFLTILLGIANSFCPNWKIAMIFRFLIGISTGGFDSSAIILVMESVGSEARLPVQTSLDCIQSIGFMYYSLVCWLCKGWSRASLAFSLMGIPSFIALLFCTESPRWVQRKKPHQLATLIKYRSKFDKTGSRNKNTEPKYHDPVSLTVPIPHPDSAELSVPGNSSISSNHLNHHIDPNSSSVATYHDFFRHKQRLRRSLMLVFSMIVTGLVGYSILFDVGNLVGNMFLNFSLLGLVNCGAAVVMVLMEKLAHPGRRTVHQICLGGVWAFLLVGVVLYATGEEHRLAWLLVASTLLASAFSFPLWIVGNLYSGELFPTDMRNMGSGLASMAARIGGILAPQLLLLFNVWKPFPFTVLVVLSILVSFGAYFIFPETRGVDLSVTENDDVNR